MALYRRARTTRALVLALVMLSLVTITVDFRGGESGPLEAAGRGALSIIGPLQTAVAHIVRPVGSFFSGIVHAGSLQAQVDRLREENATLKSQVATTASLQRQLLELKRIVKLKQRFGLHGSVAALVVGESVSNFEWSVDVDVGSSDGIKKGMPVVTGEGLVGHVVAVGATTSKVQLVIDPDSAVAVRLATTRETGLLTGQRNLDMRLSLLPQDAEIAPNEPVVTSGFRLPGERRSIYPPGLLVGYVSHVYSRQGDVEPFVSVRPAVDFGSLEYVLVVRGG